MVKQLPGQAQCGRGHPRAQVNAGDLRLADVLAGAQGRDDAIHLPDVVQFRRPLPHCVVQSGLDGMVGGQSVHPGRQEQVQLLHGELVEDGLQNIRHILLPQLKTVHRHTVDLVPGGDVPADGLRPVAVRLRRIQQDDERLSQLLQFPDDPLLRLQIVLPGDIRHRAVGGDDDADGGVLRDDLPGADLRRLRHGNLVVVPGRGDHPGGIVLVLTDGPLHHIAHAVDEPHGKGRPIGQLYLGCLLRHKFRLRRHDGPAGAALGQLIPGPLPAVYIFNIGDHLGLHEPFDEGGLPGPHRPYHTNVDIPRRAGGDILIDCGIHSIPSFFRSIFMFPLYDGLPKSMTARLPLWKPHKNISALLASFGKIPPLQP